MENHSKALKSLRADVTVEEFEATLGERDVKKGKIVYIPGKDKNLAVRLDWTMPKPESLLIVNGKYLVYEPWQKRAFTGDVEKARKDGKFDFALFFFNVSKEQLKTEYEIKYVGAEKIKETETYHLEFKPKAKKDFKTAEIWADKNGMPVSMKVTQQNNDSRTFYFTNVEKNVKINTNIFKVDLPKDTKIVK